MCSEVVIVDVADVEVVNVTLHELSELIIVDKSCT